MYYYCHVCKGVKNGGKKRVDTRPVFIRIHGILYPVISCYDENLDPVHESEEIMSAFEDHQKSGMFTTITSKDKLCVTCKFARLPADSVFCKDCVEASLSNWIPLDNVQCDVCQNHKPRKMFTMAVCDKCASARIDPEVAEESEHVFYKKVTRCINTMCINNDQTTVTGCETCETLEHVSECPVAIWG